MELRATLDPEMTRRFETVKKDTGMTDDKNVLAFLISKEYRRIERAKIHKVFLPKETYKMAEQAATARGVTMDEYVEELALEMIRKVEEAKGVKA